jgi:hypothetical protein
VDWEQLLTDIGTALQHLGIYELNGAFVMLYWLLTHSVPVLSLLGFGGMATLDLTEAERLNPALQRPTRWFTGTLRYTALVTVFWLSTAFIIPAPVPVLGLTMLLATLAIAFFERARRYQHLRRGKGALVLYSAAALGLKVYLALSADVYGWAATFGSVEVAVQTLQQGRGLVQTIAMLALLYGIPTGYLGLLVQDWISRPHSLIAPRQTAQEVVHDLRTRGGMRE